jgi:hypothetical protein
MMCEHHFDDAVVCATTGLEELQRRYEPLQLGAEDRSEERLLTIRAMDDIAQSERALRLLDVLGGRVFQYATAKKSVYSRVVRIQAPPADSGSSDEPALEFVDVSGPVGYPDTGMGWPIAATSFSMRLLDREQGLRALKGMDFDCDLDRLLLKFAERGFKVVRRH